MTDLETERRYWEKVNIRGDDDCWLWSAYIGTDGYGQFTLNRRHVPASHAALLFDGRPRPESACALHS